MPATPSTVECFPEEILEQILIYYCHSISPYPPPYSFSSKDPDSDSSSRHLPPYSLSSKDPDPDSDSSSKLSPHLAPLLVSRQFSRIYTPVLYESICLPSSNPARSRLLLETLRKCPELVEHVRQLVIENVSEECAMVLEMCRDAVLDLTIGVSHDTSRRNFDLPDGNATDVLFGGILIQLTHVRHLTLHRSVGKALLLSRARAIIKPLSEAIRSWPELQTVFVDFMLFDYASLSMTSHPLSLLTSALAAAPALHTLKTHLPFKVNNAILDVAANPCLKRIVVPSFVVPNPLLSQSQLVPTLSSSLSLSYPPPPPLPTPDTVRLAFFLKNARRYPRLAKLIEAGGNTWTEILLKPRRR